ncbi:hypothetical protein BOTBODRAFT_30045 [Botryobasidium botryosum FD-172 SS1]|uniref:Uncharacterized protein n=1 Tax=Botryobasidium botryosum (strain FD-172 SS1) TaxID=930990 RepID=A0A067MNU6_BOTB1|nr:hypothetical protein BOTBODRAFT_30045 [Botryobasidium botryosum FD-172 SS1]
MPTSSVIPHPRRRLITPLHKPNLALRLTDTALDASWFSRWTVHEGDARTRVSGCHTKQRTHPPFPSPRLDLPVEPFTVRQPPRAVYTFT